MNTLKSYFILIFMLFALTNCQAQTKQENEKNKEKIATLLVAKKDSANGWKSWQTVENFAFDVDRGKVSMVVDVRALHPYVALLAQKLLDSCRQVGLDIRIVETYRTRTKQAEYYGMGAGYTSSSAGKSKHQFGMAIDIVPFKNGKAEWYDKEMFKKVGLIGEKLGFRWGGRWASPYDPGHFEWTGGLTIADLQTGKLPKTPVDLPNLNEQINDLKTNWDGLESFQKEKYLKK